MAALNFTGVVLTGGFSRRMGQDKSLLEVSGTVLTSIVATALRSAGASEVIAVGGDIEALEALSTIDRAVSDKFPGEGPLGGILTSFEQAQDDVVVVLACDTPLVDAETPLSLLAGLSSVSDCAVAYACVDGRVQPLTAAWRRSIAIEPVRVAFERGDRAPRSVFPALKVVEVTTISPAAVEDVDHPEDLQRYAAGS